MKRWWELMPARGRLRSEVENEVRSILNRRKLRCSNFAAAETKAVTVKEALHQVVESLPDERVREVLDFARFLSWQEEREEREEWRQFGLAQLARAYGPDEPEYTEDEAQPKLAESAGQSCIGEHQNPSMRNTHRH